MHFIQLRNIGKIYTANGTIAVGIRGINLSFNVGELVAITGQSGSGKTTLLNVISGMDSYEEGELLICGTSTSHFGQKDWENYRQQYISFVFQDFQIIDSFTVLENIELALMRIADVQARRKHAMDLIEKVGLTSHAHQRGSHLSGGQKQRTAIARALARDCPVILADEPTGNLDAETSAEILKLLQTVAKDKLVLVVTHDVDEIAPYATREVRIYDGEVVSDRRLKASEVSTDHEPNPKDKNALQQNADQHVVRNGIALGWRIFRSKPKLSVFLCLFLTLASLCLFLFTGIIGKSVKNLMTDRHFLFQPEKGRVVVLKQDGQAISAQEASALAKAYGAEKVLPCDILCDSVDFYHWNQFMQDPSSYLFVHEEAPFWVSSDSDLGKPDVGRYPETVSECMIYVPYALADFFGKNHLQITTLKANELEYTVVGVKYFTDNNQMGKMILTQEGYRINCATAYIGAYLSGEITIQGGDKEEAFRSDTLVSVTYSFDVAKDKAFIKLTSAAQYMKESTDSIAMQVSLFRCKSKENTMDFALAESEAFLTYETNAICYNDMISEDGTAIVINPYTVLPTIEAYANQHYTQCSLYFSTAQQLTAAVEQLNAAGYIAFSSDTTYAPPSDAISSYLFSAVLMVLIWLVLVIFLMLFVKLGMKRNMAVLGSDVSIMRSIGVKVQTIQLAVCVCMIVSMMLAAIVTLTVRFFIYRNAFGSRLIMYLSPMHYFFIFLGLILITFGVTNNQMKMLFGATVKQALKGDVST